MIEAMKQALEALENAEYGDYDKKELNDAITSLRQAIAEAEKNHIEDNLEMVQELLQPFWGGGPTNKDYEDAMRIKRLSQIVTPQRQDPVERPAPCARHCEANAYEIVIRGLKGQLERAEQQKPVAWADMEVRGEDKGLSWTPGQFHKMPLYTHPAREPLTDEQIIGLWQDTKEPDGHRIERFARAIEAAHGIREKK